MHNQRGNPSPSFSLPFVQPSYQFTCSAAPYSQSTFTSETQLAAQFQRCMTIQEKLPSKSQILGPGWEKHQRLEATPQKSKSLIYKAEEAGFLATRPKKKLQHVEDRFKTPPRRITCISSEELERDLRKRRQMQGQRCMETNFDE